VPNPTDGNFIVSGLEVGEQLSIVDVNGRTVWSSLINNETEKISIEGYAQGMYYLQTIVGGKLGKLKLIKL
jgi:hypothetical protein